ncbi:hypothetical protein, partial [Pseudanabaena sp. 'Roaring Creek']|uniref:hypothetical protein n=1 Tax=Pseudanabaena sp. 'Roaring Creek' TaxID=1681830 RepID=UPI0006D7FF7A
FEKGFATQTLSQSPKVKALRSKAFTFGLLQFASLTRTDVTYTKAQNGYSILSFENHYWVWFLINKSVVTLS